MSTETSRGGLRHMAKRPIKGKRKSSSAAPVAEQASRPISVVLIDDNRVLREGLVTMLHNQPGFKALAASADETEALEQVRAAKPDIVLIDYGLIDNDSLGITTKVRAEVPDAKLIVMGLLTTEDDVADYVRAGASGFVMKDATFDELAETIRAVADGGDALPRTLTPALFDQIVSDEVTDSPEPVVVDSVVLTRREQEVVSLIGEGLTNKGVRHSAQHRRAHRQEPRAQRPQEACPAEPPGSRRVRPCQAVCRPQEARW